ncbi:hypothetical protein THIX_10663 [Thiomonas sp. X19]|nr:hypothetical protein THIX_10663 [Thiomonas sp. X19]
MRRRSRLPRRPAPCSTASAPSRRARRWAMCSTSATAFRSSPRPNMSAPWSRPCTTTAARCAAELAAGVPRSVWSGMSADSPPGLAANVVLIQAPTSRSVRSYAQFSIPCSAAIKSQTRLEVDQVKLLIIKDNFDYNRDGLNLSTNLSTAQRRSRAWTIHKVIHSMA